MTPAEVLNVLENYNVRRILGSLLEQPYSYTIDSRLNIFTSAQKELAIVSGLVVITRSADCITLDLTYLGNCLIKHPKSANNRTSNRRKSVTGGYGSVS